MPIRRASSFVSGKSKMDKLMSALPVGKPKIPKSVQIVIALLKKMEAAITWYGL